MKVLHVNNTDIPGRRFNGYDLLGELKPRGIEGKQAVLFKVSDNPDVVPLVVTQEDRKLHQACITVEQRHSMNNLLFPWARVLVETPEFLEADVVHLHLPHNQVISLVDLPDVVRRKPTVWTFHDAWALTGHCINPTHCDKWLNGCVGCPQLDAVFEMKADCADKMWKIKQRAFAELDVDIVVASEYTLDMVRRSPLTSHFERVHLMPFGVNVDSFVSPESRAESRKCLGIPEDDFVVFFRSANGKIKGLSYIIEALRSRPPDRPTTLLTVDQLGLLKGLSSDYRVMDMGWVEDHELYVRMQSACDVFLMPSIAEGFGLMALEAMAAERPVICFDSTSVASVTHAPDCGIAVPHADSARLRDAMDLLAENPDEAERRGKLGRQIAREHYDHDHYLDAMAALYREVLGRHGR